MTTRLCMMILLQACLCVGVLAEAPNIVLILADDLGWTGLRCFGSDFYETPNIDRLAENGMRFDSGFANATNCAPSRASLMSGQVTPRHHIFTVGNYQDKWKQKHGDLKRFKLIQPQNAKSLSRTARTLAESLKLAGYTTGMFGKWHLGRGDQHPSQRGFDVAIESSGAHFDFKTDPDVTHPSDQYLSDFLGDHAVTFMEKNHDAGKPFFLYLPDFLVHAPLEAKARYLAQFRAKTPGTYQRSPVAAAMVMSLDDTVGRVVNKIQALGIEKNTLIVFTSDNGGLSYAEDGKRAVNTSNYPLRERKGSEFDGGLRVPFIFSWPGRIEARTLQHESIQFIDLYPTFLQLAGAPQPDHVLDGVDLSPVLFDAQARLKMRDLFWYLPFYSSFNRPSVVVRRGHWKLIHLLESGLCELYHTGQDIGERSNLAGKYPDLALELKTRTLDWLDDTEAPRMVLNPDYAP